MSDDRFLRANPNPVPLDAMTQPDMDVREFRTDEDIANLADSMATKGQVMPVLLGRKRDGQYPILDGNHRHLAAKRLGWPNLDAILVGAGVDEDEAQIVANLSRISLSPAEKLATFDYLLNTLDMSVTDAAEKVGLDKASVSRYGQVLAGYGEIKQYFMEGELGLRACVELNRIGDRDRAVDIAERAVREGYKDKDVVVQAKHVRAEEGAKDVMRGAGTTESMQNRQQVKRNVQAMQDLEPTPQAPQGATAEPPQGPEGPTMPGPDEGELDDYDGPTCDVCGAPAPDGHFCTLSLAADAVPGDVASEFDACGECGQGLLQFLNQIQQQAAQAAQ